MGRVQVEQGDLDAALETFRNATRITPQSIGRLQKQGMLAFYMGHGDEAAEALERSVRIGLTSKMFDCQSLVLLAICLIPAGAHLFEMPGKMRMGRDAYFSVQPIYNGWALFGAALGLAIIALVVLT
jgi:tetratricopeptide (TPR) repeat protein